MEGATEMTNEIFTERTDDGKWMFQVISWDEDFEHTADGYGYDTEDAANDAACEILESWGLI